MKRPEQLRILTLSKHFLDGTSEGLCAARVAQALARAGHEVTIIAGRGTRGPETEAGSTPGETEPSEPGSSDRGYRLVRVTGRTSRFLSLWATANKGAGKTLLHRVVSSLLNRHYGSNALQWAWADAASDEAVRLILDARERASGAGTAASPLGDGARPGFDLIFSRLNPVASHLAVLSVKEKLRQRRSHLQLPWCAYFSDPWPDFLFPPPFDFRAGALSRGRSLRQLETIATSADSLLFPSRRLARYLTSWMAGERGSDDLEQKSCVAPHIGLQAESTLLLGPTEAVDGHDMERERMVVRHAGFLMGERRIEPLLEALRMLPEAVLRDISVEFMGRSSGVSRRVPPDLVSAVRFEGAGSPEEAQQWLRQADVSLLVESDFAEGIFLPSKFAEYASLENPILALSPNSGTVADYMKLGGGLQVPPSESTGIADALQSLHGRWRNRTLDELRPPQTLRSHFDPVIVVEQIEQCFAATISRARSRWPTGGQ